MTYSKYLVKDNMTIGFNRIEIEKANPETCEEYLMFLLDADRSKPAIAVIRCENKPELKLDFKNHWTIGNKETTNCFFKMV